MDPTIVTPGAFASSDPIKRRAREQRRRVARALRQGSLGLVLAATGIAAVLALRPRPVPIDLGRTTRGPLVVAIEESGKTRVIDRYLVSAPVGGNVDRVELQEGDLVKEGDVLARIAPALSAMLDERGREETEARLSAALSSQGQANAQAERARVAVEQAEVDRARARGTGCLGGDRRAGARTGALRRADAGARGVLRGLRAKGRGRGGARAARDARQGGSEREPRTSRRRLRSRLGQGSPRAPEERGRRTRGDGPARDRRPHGPRGGRRPSHDGRGARAARYTGDPGRLGRRHSAGRTRATARALGVHQAERARRGRAAG